MKLHFDWLGWGGGGLKILDFYIFIIIFSFQKLESLNNGEYVQLWSVVLQGALLSRGVLLRHKLMIYDSCKLHFLLTAKSWTEVTEKLSWVLHVDLLLLIKYHLKIFQVTDSLCLYCLSSLIYPSSFEFVYKDGKNYVAKCQLYFP